jgi:hypothetical protein
VCSNNYFSHIPHQTCTTDYNTHTIHLPALQRTPHTHILTHSLTHSHSLAHPHSFTRPPALTRPSTAQVVRMLEYTDVEYETYLQNPTWSRAQTGECVCNAFQYNIVMKKGIYRHKSHSLHHATLHYTTPTQTSSSCSASGLTSASCSSSTASCKSQSGGPDTRTSQYR